MMRERIESALRAIALQVLRALETDEGLFELKCRAMRRGGIGV
jgi:hypothetical protein